MYLVLKITSTDGEVVSKIKVAFYRTRCIYRDY